MEFKGTKGEWKVSASFEYSGLYDLVTDLGAPTFGEDDHNAKLIASAPDLLKALQSCLIQIEDDLNAGCVDKYFAELRIEKAKQAINKALK